MNRNTQTSALMIYGDPSNPQSALLGASDEIVYLSSLPTSGIMYSFIPQQ